MAEQSIAQRIRLLDKRVRPMRTAALEAVNREHYYPEYLRIVADCAAEGHVEGAFQNNGLGVSWFDCAKCGARIPETVEVWRIDEEEDAQAACTTPAVGQQESADGEQ